MATDPRDDFAVFKGSEHMFFGLKDAFGLIRSETEAGLRKQVADTVVNSIIAFDTPKFLTIGRKTDDPNNVIVTAFAFCLRATLDVSYDAGQSRDQMSATLTFMFANVDQPGNEVSTVHFDLHGDAERMFDDDVFKDRFLAFRYGQPPPTAANDPS